MPLNPICPEMFAKWVTNLQHFFSLICQPLPWHLNWLIGTLYQVVAVGALLHVVRQGFLHGFPAEACLPVVVSFFVGSILPMIWIVEWFSVLFLYLSFI